MAEAVDRSGVDPVDAEFDRPMNRRDRFRVVLFAPAEAPIAAAPKPMGVISRSELPSLRRSIVVSIGVSACLAWG